MRFLLLLACILCVRAEAQITFDGCVDYRGVPVASVPNYQLNDIAQAIPNAYGTSVIQFNPQVVAWVSPATRLFFYAHECAHLAVPTGDESAADCWAATMLVNRGLLNALGIQIVEGEIARFGRADWSHVGGPQRAINIQACLSD